MSSRPHHVISFLFPDMRSDGRIKLLHIFQLRMFFLVLCAVIGQIVDCFCLVAVFSVLCKFIHPFDILLLIFSISYKGIFCIQFPISCNLCVTQNVVISVLFNSPQPPLFCCTLFVQPISVVTSNAYLYLWNPTA